MLDQRTGHPESCRDLQCGCAMQIAAHVKRPTACGHNMIGRRKRGLLVACVMAIMELEDHSPCAHVWNGVPSICLLSRIW
jgi:hypothetical protein